MKKTSSAMTIHSRSQDAHASISAAPRVSADDPHSAYDTRRLKQEAMGGQELGESDAYEINRRVRLRRWKPNNPASDIS